MKVRSNQYIIWKTYFFCKDINFDNFYILQRSSNFSIKCEIQYLLIIMLTYAFSDNCKIYYNKSFYDGQNVDIVQENLSFHNNWK